jgi:hypothetical protein
MSRFPLPWRERPNFAPAVGKDEDRMTPNDHHLEAHWSGWIAAWR